MNCTQISQFENTFHDISPWARLLLEHLEPETAITLTKVSKTFYLTINNDDPNLMHQIIIPKVYGPVVDFIIQAFLEDSWLVWSFLPKGFENPLLTMEKVKKYNKLPNPALDALLQLKKDQDSTKEQVSQARHLFLQHLSANAPPQKWKELAHLDPQGYTRFCEIYLAYQGNEEIQAYQAMIKAFNSNETEVKVMQLEKAHQHFVQYAQQNGPVLGSGQILEMMVELDPNRACEMLEELNSIIFKSQPYNAIQLIQYLMNIFLQKKDKYTALAINHSSCKASLAFHGQTPLHFLLRFTNWNCLNKTFPKEGFNQFNALYKDINSYLEQELSSLSSEVIEPLIIIGEKFLTISRKFGENLLKKIQTLNSGNQQSVANERLETTLALISDQSVTLASHHMYDPFTGSDKNPLISKTLLKNLTFSGLEKSDVRRIAAMFFFNDCPFPDMVTKGHKKFRSINLSDP